MTLLEILRKNEQVYAELKHLVNNPNESYRNLDTVNSVFSCILKYYKDKGLDLRLNARNLAERFNIDDHTFICGDCNYLENCEMGGQVYNDESVCEQCLSDDYTYSEAQDTYISHDDYATEMYEENNRDDEYVYAWDYDVADELGFKYLPNQDRKTTVTYGIELEVERRRNADDDISELVHEEVYKFARLKSDGSLSNGFEIVTTPCSYEYQKEKWSKFLKSDLIKQLRGWKTDTAGLHIHIGKKQLKPSEIGKLLIFINSEENTQLIDDIAGRTSYQWAKKHPKKITDSLYRTSRDDRYEAVNMSNEHTVELRIFKSNLSHNGFMRVLEFADALVHFTKQTGLSGMSLHYKSFLRYMEQPENRTTYPIFYAWLCHNKYSGGRASRKVETTQSELVLKEAQTI